MSQRKPKYTATHDFPADTPLQMETDWLRTHLILNNDVHFPEINCLWINAEKQLHLFDDGHTTIFRVFTQAPRTTKSNA